MGERHGGRGFLAVHWHWPWRRCFFPFGWLCRFIGHDPCISRLAVSHCDRCGDNEWLPWPGDDDTRTETIIPLRPGSARIRKHQEGEGK